MPSEVVVTGDMSQPDAIGDKAGLILFPIDTRDVERAENEFLLGIVPLRHTEQ